MSKKGKTKKVEKKQPKEKLFKLDITFEEAMKEIVKFKPEKKLNKNKKG